VEIVRAAMTQPGMVEIRASGEKGPSRKLSFLTSNISLYFLPWKIDFSFISGTA